MQALRDQLRQRASEAFDAIDAQCNRDCIACVARAADTDAF
eukprot:gene6389-4550_t